MRDGRWLVIGQVGDDKLLIQDPASRAPEALPLEVFAEPLGRAADLLIARRATLGDTAPALRHRLVHRRHQASTASR